MNTTKTTTAAAKKTHGTFSVASSDANEKEINKISEYKIKVLHLRTHASTPRKLYIKLSL